MIRTGDALSERLSILEQLLHRALDSSHLPIQLIEFQIAGFFTMCESIPEAAAERHGTMNAVVRTSKLSGSFQGQVSSLLDIPTLDVTRCGVLHDGRRYEPRTAGST